jgi:transcription elongation factor Elf1
MGRTRDEPLVRCPVCNRKTAVMTSWRLRAHNDQPGVRCTGSGAAVTIRIEERHDHPAAPDP